ncbi:hypothetical protein [Methylomonas sp. DH-1]|uniref:hypothetical protein n=1 Tax=Methylomonas sp. (strain DH-1) TaxID=1727196 RepID=UPI0007C8CA82|nr:hypothetical protein [Methylomonas sp. DH-1]ANE55207.1 hypothetical protein AYM39_08465 [Methylomonas sp. DH-1]
MNFTALEFVALALVPDRLSRNTVAGPWRPHAGGTGLQRRTKSPFPGADRCRLESRLLTGATNTPATHIARAI